MRRTDPLIIGGGPAGAAAAIHLLRAGAAPVIIERQAAVGDALCGGFLSWRTLDLLDSLGLPRSDLAGQPITALRLFTPRTVHRFILPAPAMGLSRRKLDGLLLAKARQQGAQVRQATAAYENGAIRLDGGETLACDSLFLATGKHDLRGLARPRDAAGGDPLLGLRLRLQPSDRLTALLAGHIEMHVFSGGYIGILLQEDGSANACMAVRKSRLAAAGGNPAALFIQLPNDSPALGQRLANMPARPRIDAVSHIPYGWRARTTVPGIFRLGDQAGVIASLAGEGIGIALASAQAAVRYWSEGGSAAAPAYQRAFSQSLRRPLAMGEWLGSLARRPSLAVLPLALLSIVPGAARLIARATRIR